VAVAVVDLRTAAVAEAITKLIAFVFMICVVARSAALRCGLFFPFDGPWRPATLFRARGSNFLIYSFASMFGAQ